MSIDPAARRHLSLVEALRRQPPGAPVPSPCVGVCRMDESSGLCAGCWRTLDEIAIWGRSDDTARRRIWQAVEARQSAALR